MARLNASWVSGLWAFFSPGSLMSGHLFPMHRGLQAGVYRFLSTQRLFIGKTTQKIARSNMPSMQDSAPQCRVTCSRWSHSYQSCGKTPVVAPRSKRILCLAELLSSNCLLGFFSLSFLTFTVVVFSWGLELITSLSEQFHSSFCVCFSYLAWLSRWLTIIFFSKAIHLN